MTAQLDEVQAQIQSVMKARWVTTGCRGTIVAATGSGKSKIAVDRIVELVELGRVGVNSKALLVVPTERLRDENWPSEFKKWGHEWIFENCVEPICFASLKKEKGNHYPIMILDEIHRLTDHNSAPFMIKAEDSDLVQFVSANAADEVMGLTATMPDPKRDIIKFMIINQVAPPVFKYTLDQGVDDGVITDFEIRVIMLQLDNVNKNILAGNKDKKFYQTEAAQYIYLNQRVTQMDIKARQAGGSDKASMFMRLNRQNFIYNLPSKTAFARDLIPKIAPRGTRLLAFCGSIEQSRELFGENVYNSKDKKLGALQKFKDGEIDQCGVVNAVNEGHNIPGLDVGLVIQINANERDIVQRLGRFLRLRPDKPDHKAIVYILCVQGTVDEKWLDKALKNFDRSRIKYESAKNYV